VKFVYKAEGVTPREWEFEPAKLMSPECMAIEKLTGLTFQEWAESVKKGSIRSMHAYLWVLLKRENPTLQPKEVQFSPSEVDFQPSDDEIRKVFEAFADKADSDWDDEDRENVAILRAQYPHLIPDEATEDDDEPGPDALDDVAAEVIPDPKD